MRDVSLTASRPRFDAIESSAINRSAASLTSRRKSTKPRQFSLQRTGYAMLIGICALTAIGVPMNALFFQDARHPAPMFLTTALTPTSPAPAVAKSTAIHLVETPATPIEGNRPKAELPRPTPKIETAHNVSIPSAKNAARPSAKLAEVIKRDPIAELLDGAARPKPTTQSDVLMAQQALLKLGYVVRADGRLNKATQQAIEKFEHDNGLPVKGALTSKIAALLASRAGLESE